MKLVFHQWKAFFVITADSAVLHTMGLPVRMAGDYVHLPLEHPAAAGGGILAAGMGSEQKGGVKGAGAG